MQMFAIEDGTDDVLLNVFGPSAPTLFSFVDGSTATSPSAGSLVARVTPDGLAWAAAIDAFVADEPAVTWLSKVGDGFALSGGIGDNELTNVITNQVWLNAVDDGRAGFIADLDPLGTISKVILFPPSSVVAWVASLDGRRFGAREAAVDNDVRFSLVSDDDSNEPIELATSNGGISFPGGLAATTTALVAGFSATASGTAVGELDITPLVPDAEVRAQTSSFVLAVFPPR